MNLRFLLLCTLIILSAGFCTGQTKDPFRLKAIDKTADYLCRFEKPETVYSPFKENDSPDQEHITGQSVKFKATSRTFIDFLLLKQPTFTTTATKRRLTNSKDISFRDFVDSLIIGGLLGNDPGRIKQAKFRALSDTLKILVKEEGESRSKVQVIKKVSAAQVNPEIIGGSGEPDTAATNDSLDINKNLRVSLLKEELEHAVKLADPKKLRVLIGDKKNRVFDSVIEPYRRIMSGYAGDVETGDSLFDVHNYREALKSYNSAQSWLQSEEISRRIDSTSNFDDFIRHKRISHIILISVLIVLFIAGIAAVVIMIDNYSELIRRIEETISISKYHIEEGIETALPERKKNRWKLMERLDRILKTVRSYSEAVDQKEKTIQRLEKQIADEMEEKRTSSESVDRMKKIISDQERNEIQQNNETTAPPPLQYPRILYAIGPEEDGFPAEKLKMEKTAKTVFKITLIDEKRGTFEIPDENDAFEHALANEKFILKPACDYDNSSVNGGKIKTLHEGELIRKGEIWVIEKKALIAFYRI
jgi:hypothetical protein